MSEAFRLAPARLYTTCDLSTAGFESTQDLADLTEFIGQARARGAVQFGTGMRHEGYNLFVVGPPGVGKHSLVTQFLTDAARGQATPSDWCYVNNFADDAKPRVLQLPAGRGAALRAEMMRLVEELRTVIPAAFESVQYRAQAEGVHGALEQREEQAVQRLGEEAAKQDIALLHTEDGFMFAPARAGEAMSPDEYEKLPAADKARIDQLTTEYQERLQAVLRQFPGWRREMREQMRQLNRDTALHAAEHLIEELCGAYTDLPWVVDYLRALQQDIVDNASLFMKQEGSDVSDLPVMHRYEVNLVVDHRETQGAPIVLDDHPVLDSLIGRVEHVAQMGALLTDFTMIKAGSLHRANGGYLLIDAHKLLTQPFAWDALKRALAARELRIESVGQLLSLISTVSLEPEPIPLNVKVILFGDRSLYYLLQEVDPEFPELFKVVAEFEESVPRTAETDLLYARLVATLVRKEALLHFARDAVARVIEHAARDVEDAAKVSTHMESLADLLRQSDYWARQAHAQQVTATHVQQAIDAVETRGAYLKEQVQEEILRGTLLIDTAGGVPGQVNGLSVVELGSQSFAHPVRITATTRIGDGDVVDIEREVELGGALHSKGVLILSSFLATRYSRNRPLSLAASLVFEQSYGYVEGDSASLAELCALLSDLAQLPVRQSLAVTGSVNQFGQVQPIGAVNHKIEGFFDLCQARGLSGDQGVLIPAANVQHLMLKRAVVEAVAAGTFHIYAVADVDQAIEVLTGVAAGTPDDKGQLPEGSVNYLVAVRLLELAMIRQSFGEGSKPHRGRKRKPH